MRLPFINIRKLVVYPGTETSIHVGRDISVAAVEAARAAAEPLLLLVAQKRSEQNDAVGLDDMYRTGTVVRLERAVRLGEGCKFHGAGTAAFAIDQIEVLDGVRWATGRELSPDEDSSVVPDALRLEYAALLRDWCARFHAFAEHPGVARLAAERSKSGFIRQLMGIVSYFRVDETPLLTGAEHQRSMDAHRELINRVVEGRQRLLEAPAAAQTLDLIGAMLREELRLTA